MFMVAEKEMLARVDQKLAGLLEDARSAVLFETMRHQLIILLQNDWGFRDGGEPVRFWHYGR